MKQELACIGFTLSNEQMKELYRVQQMALLRYRWVETRRECIFDILKPFLNSPYMAQQTYLSLFQQSIVLYYHIRSSIDWQVSDEILCEILYEEYLLHHGEIDQKLVKAVMQHLRSRKEEA